jgi:hypothetical protein
MNVLAANEQWLMVADPRVCGVSVTGSESARQWPRLKRQASWAESCANLALG